ncbi:haloacid dehalogenase-like hydrolase [Dokdonella soli]|uniref:HAD family hydrolase n=1 Tax=Dokdonella soli TaxID=529810 RepID=A0ABP3TT02_9GAMM
MNEVMVSAKAGARGKPRVVLFDFDGVLVRGDAFTRFMRDRYAHAWWRAVLVLPLWPLLALLATTPRGRRTAARVLVRWALCGVGESCYRELAETFGRALARDARNLSREALAALNAHRHAGDRIFVATACEEILARAILDELGLAAIELVASRLVPGRLGMRIALHNRGVEKANQLARRGVRPPWDIVYSDSLDDLPILAAARSAVLVNPSRHLLARVSARLGQRVSIVEWN